MKELIEWIQNVPSVIWNAPVEEFLLGCGIGIALGLVILAACFSPKGS